MGDLEMVEILLAAGANATALGDDGYAPIHRACWGEDRGHMEVVERLVLHGVDPALPTASGRTPFELVQYNQATRELLTMALREAREKEL
jgi:ankyrin repeat protein